MFCPSYMNCTSGEQINNEGKLLCTELTQIINNERIIEGEYTHFTALKELMTLGNPYVPCDGNK